MVVNIIVDNIFEKTGKTPRELADIIIEITDTPNNVFEPVSIKVIRRRHGKAIIDEKNIGFLSAKDRFLLKFNALKIPINFKNIDFGTSTNGDENDGNADTYSKIYCVYKGKKYRDIIIDASFSKDEAAFSNLYAKYDKIPKALTKDNILIPVARANKTHQQKACFVMLDDNNSVGIITHALPDQGKGYAVFNSITSKTSPLTVKNMRAWGGMGRQLYCSLMVGTQNNDVFFASPYKSEMKTKKGHDISIGSQLGEHIETGDGNDIVHAQRGRDIVETGNGSDIVTGGDGDDLILTGLGRDIVVLSSTFRHSDHIYLHDASEKQTPSQSSRNIVIMPNDIKHDQLVSFDTEEDALMATISEQVLSDFSKDDVFIVQMKDKNDTIEQIKSDLILAFSKAVHLDEIPIIDEHGNAGSLEKPFIGVDFRGHKFYFHNKDKLWQRQINGKICLRNFHVRTLPYNSKLDDIKTLQGLQWNNVMAQSQRVPFGQKINFLTWSIPTPSMILDSLKERARANGYWLPDTMLKNYKPVQSWHFDLTMPPSSDVSTYQKKYGFTPAYQPMPLLLDHFKDLLPAKRSKNNLLRATLKTNPHGPRNMAQSISFNLDNPQNVMRYFNKLRIYYAQHALLNKPENRCYQIQFTTGDKPFTGIVRQSKPMRLEYNSLPQYIDLDLEKLVRGDYRMITCGALILPNHRIFNKDGQSLTNQIKFQLINDKGLSKKLLTCERTQAGSLVYKGKNKEIQQFMDLAGVTSPNQPYHTDASPLVQLHVRMRRRN